MIYTKRELSFYFFSRNKQPLQEIYNITFIQIEFIIKDITITPPMLLLLFKSLHFLENLSNKRPTLY